MIKPLLTTIAICLAGYFAISYALEPAKATRAECERLTREFDERILKTIHSKDELGRAIVTFSRKKTLTDDDKNFLAWKSSTLQLDITLGKLAEDAAKQCVERLAQGI